MPAQASQISKGMRWTWFLSMKTKIVPLMSVAAVPKTVLSYCLLTWSANKRWLDADKLPVSVLFCMVYSLFGDCCRPDQQISGSCSARFVNRCTKWKTGGTQTHRRPADPWRLNDVIQPEPADRTAGCWFKLGVIINNNTPDGDWPVDRFHMESNVLV